MNGVDSLARVLAMAGLGQGGGGGETPTSYNQLSDKPLVNGFELIGSLTGDQLGLQDAIDEDHKLPAEYVSGLADVAFSGEYDDLINKPALADVATSGDYNDLINKPEQITKTSELINDGSDGEHPFLTEHQSLAGYATENWVENKGYLTEHQSLAGYATENFVTSQGYLTEIPSEYAKKTDIPSVEGLASEQYVNDELAKKQNTITDLAAIRSGAALGATAIQEHQSLKTINGESIVGTGNIEIQGGSGTTPEQVREIVEGYNYTTLATVESQGYLKEVPAIYAKVVMLTQAEYNALSTKDEHTLYIITDAAE